MDQLAVKKIPTHKSGNFVFSAHYSNAELVDLLAESRVLYRTIKDLPILPSIAASIQQDIIKRSIFGTAAIEGNPLSEEKVESIISQPKTDKFKEEAEIEIVNLKEVYDVIKGMPGTPQFHVTEELIKQIHKTITKGIKYPFGEPGYYRSARVQVGDLSHGGVYTPPKCFDDVKKLMGEFIAWINREEILQLLPQIRAALAHYHFALIHPFDDGNGRTARALEAIILKVADMKYVPIMLSNYYYKNIDDYFRAFTITEKNKEMDVTHFIKFVLTGIVNSLNEIKDNINFSIINLTLKNYYAFLRKEAKGITQRQHDLLKILLDTATGIFTLKDLFESPVLSVLYRKVSERTALRDLKKLHEMTLLKKVDKNKNCYELHMKTLSNL